MDFVFNAQGEDVVSGRHAGDDTEQLPMVLPEVPPAAAALLRA